MKKFNSHIRRYDWIVPALSGIVVFFIVFLRVKLIGAYVFSDAIVYISLAHSFAKNYTFLKYNNEYGITEFNPLTSAIWGILLKITDLDIITIVGLINAIALGITVFISARWIYILIQSNIIRIGSILLLIFSLALLSVAYMAMTDTLFNLFVLAFLFTAQLFLKIDNKKVFHPVIIAGICLTVLAIFTRWIGISLVFVGISLLLFNYITKYRFTDIRKSVIVIVAYSMCSILPLLVFMIYNKIVVGSASEHLNRFLKYGPPDLSVLHYFALFFKYLINWFVPVPQEIYLFISIILKTWIGNIFIIFCLLIILSICSYVIFNKTRNKNIDIKTIPAHYIVFVLFTIIYITNFILVFCFTLPNHYINEKHSLPLYIPCVIICAVLINSVCNNFKKYQSIGKLCCIGIFIASLVICINVGYNSYKLTTNTESLGLANNSVLESDIAIFIKNYSFGNFVYSNSSFLVYHYHNKPHKKIYNMRDLHKTDLQKEIDKGNHIEIIWFNDTHHPDRVNIKEQYFTIIDNNTKIKILFENKNAIVYDIYALKQ